MKNIKITMNKIIEEVFGEEKDLESIKTEYQNQKNMKKKNYSKIIGKMIQI